MAENISEQQEFLIKTLKENGASLVGFGDVSSVEPEITKNLPVAISFGVKYNEKIVENLHLDEESFHNHLVELNTPITQLISIIENLLSKWGYQYETVPINILI